MRVAEDVLCFEEVVRELVASYGCIGIFFREGRNEILRPHLDEGMAQNPVVG